MTDDQRPDAGLKQSSVHVDFVLGSADPNVYGVAFPKGLHHQIDLRQIKPGAVMAERRA